MKNLFHFKQFSVDDSCCAMKTGTDAVLLGAMAGSANPLRILDIGTGSGIIALMLAQRFPESLIDAVEIDAEAAACAARNFNNSEWHTRMNVISMSLQEYSTVCRHQYDLIVTNPPFFSNSLLNTDTKKAVARHDHTLPLPDLMRSCGKLLKKKAQLWLIIPADKYKSVLLQAVTENLFLTQKTSIFSSQGSKPKRCVLAFGKEESLEAISSDLSIYERNGVYTAAFRELCKDFYPGF